MIWIYCAVGLIVTVVLGVIWLSRRNPLRTFELYLCLAEQEREKGDVAAYEVWLGKAERLIGKAKDEITRFRMEAGLLQQQARTQFRLGNLLGADISTRKCLELAKAKDPGDTTGFLSSMHVFRAELAQEQGNLTESIALFREAVRITGGTGHGVTGLFYWQMLIDALREAGQYDEALRAVDEAREIEKKFFEATEGEEGAKKVISMMEPDRALVVRDYETAKQLLLVKVSNLNLMATSVIDPTRYFVNLAEAMAGLGEIEGARNAMGAAIAQTKAMLCEGHPRLKRMEAKLEALAVAQ